MIFIRIKVNGYLKNITDNEIFKFDEKAIKNKNNISYCCDGVKTTIKIKDNEILLIRDGNDFINTFLFNEKNSSCNYLLKNNNYDVDIDIANVCINIEENSICIKYLIVDSKCEYEYKLEMSDI